MKEPDAQTSPLSCEMNGAIATITLTRPGQFNAFDTALRAELLAVVKKLEADAEIRIVILKGEGRGFCAGADLGDGVSDPVSDQLNNEYKPFLTAITESDKIYIAQVHGVAAGIGAALAMVCDLVVMEKTATLYMAFAAIGLIPDGGNTWLLLKAMGYHRALETIIEGKHLTAKECLAHGIANKLADGDEIDAITRAWAGRLAGGAPLALVAAKKVLRQVEGVSYADAISLEAQYQDPLVQSKDFKNAVDAFFKKEKPVFIGK